MIFVSVGTAHKPFDSILRVLDAYAEESGKQVIAQIGNAEYTPKHCQWFRFASHAQIISYIQGAEFIVTHGGYAILGECLRAAKPVLAVPRSRERGEAVNDQIELLERLHELGLIDFVRGPEELSGYLRFGRIPPVPKHEFVSRIPELIKRFVDQYIVKKT
jgi:UDP-N-acetylglucosamine transferase subunit ALG13